jgi:membrane-bound hydrogenase subunit mbhJ
MRLLNWARKSSPWLYHLSTGTCNGCDIELVAAITPKYDVERLGCKLVGSPRHADLLCVTGPVTSKSRKRFLMIYDQVPERKLVLAIGTCAISGGIFRGSKRVSVGVDRHVKVDVYVPGCPPSPKAIIHAISKTLRLLG